MTRDELMRDYEAAVEIYEYQCEHGGLGDISTAKDEMDRIDAELTQMDNDSNSASAVEKEDTMTTTTNTKLQKVTNQNVSGKAAHAMKDLLRRVLLAAEIDATGIKFTVSNGKYAKRGGMTVSENVVTIPEGMETFTLVKAILKGAWRARRNIDIPGFTDRTWADTKTEVMDFLAAVSPSVYENLTDEERVAWIAGESAALEKAARIERERAEEEERRPEMIIESAKKRAAEAEARVQQILSDMAKNITYEYSWRVVELGEKGHLARAFRGFVESIDAERDERFASSSSSERLAAVKDLLEHHLRAMIGEVMGRKPWEDNGSQGSLMDSRCKATAYTEFAQWCEAALGHIQLKTTGEYRNPMCGFSSFTL